MTTLLFFVGVFCGILLAGFLHMAGDSDMEQELAMEHMKRKKAEAELKKKEEEERNIMRKMDLYSAMNKIALAKYGVELKYFLDRGWEEDEEILNRIFQEAEKLLELSRNAEKKTEDER